MKRGIYLLPNLLTTGNLFCGFYSIIATINHDFRTAAIAILFAILFDILDGKVARLTGSSSLFGVEYDSLADLVAFGVAPALLVYMWALKPFGRLGWGAAFAAWGGERLSSLLPVAPCGWLVSTHRLMRLPRSISWDFPFPEPP
jgi:phosphatidylserine synthase